MTEQEIQKRLLAAALMDDVAIPEGMEERLHATLQRQKPRVLPLQQVGRAAIAAAVVAAVAMPAMRWFGQTEVEFTDTCQNADEARYELQNALAAIQTTPAGNELFNLVQ